MAEGFLKAIDKNLEVYSAGTEPASQVHPKAIQVMGEAGINLKDNYPKNVDEFLYQNFDFLITVCDGARESCPFFTGKVNLRLHIGFEDPAKATGTEEEILAVFRKIRDQIREEITKFYFYYIKKTEINHSRG
jgi:arsenate reductase